MHIGLVSDFVDYYDGAFDMSNNVQVYRRCWAEKFDKSEGLRRLRAAGIQTVSLKAVKSISSASQKVMVITDATKHDGTGGRLLMSYREAEMMYPNTLACEYYAEAGDIVYRMLHIGKQRYSMILRGCTVENAKGTVIQEIGRMVDSYTDRLGIPIFAVDYINTSEGLKAISLRNIEWLAGYGNIITGINTPEAVANEVYRSLVRYNKI